MVNFHSYVNVYQRVYESPTRWWSYPTHPTQIATWIGTLMIHLFNFQTNHEAQKEIFNLSKRAVATRQNHGKLMDGLDGWKPQVFGRYDGDVISNDLWLYIYICYSPVVNGAVNKAMVASTFQKKWCKWSPNYMISDSGWKSQLFDVFLWIVDDWLDPWWCAHKLAHNWECNPSE